MPALGPAASSAASSEASSLIPTPSQSRPVVVAADNDNAVAVVSTPDATAKTTMFARTRTIATPRSRFPKLNTSTHTRTATVTFATPSPFSSEDFASANPTSTGVPAETTTISSAELPYAAVTVTKALATLPPASDTGATASTVLPSNFADASASSWGPSSNSTNWYSTSGTTSAAAQIISASTTIGVLAACAVAVVVVMAVGIYRRRRQSSRVYAPTAPPPRLTMLFAAGRNASRPAEDSSEAVVTVQRHKCIGPGCSCMLVGRPQPVAQPLHPSTLAYLNSNVFNDEVHIRVSKTTASQQQQQEQDLASFQLISPRGHASRSPSYRTVITSPPNTPPADALSHIPASPPSPTAGAQPRFFYTDAFFDESSGSTSSQSAVSSKASSTDARADAARIDAMLRRARTPGRALGAMPPVALRPATATPPPDADADADADAHSATRPPLPLPSPATAPGHRAATASVSDISTTSLAASSLAAGDVSGHGGRPASAPDDVVVVALAESVDSRAGAAANGGSARLLLLPRGAGDDERELDLQRRRFLLRHVQN
ncbi:hypothetical protein HDU83_002796 [Entophlyctis luteolus]|nr:hypothetical protein HDU83_002796 [Entophlyctis luteolus]